MQALIVRLCRKQTLKTVFSVISNWLGFHSWSEIVNEMKWNEINFEVAVEAAENI